ncbi:uncharacterized [Tachysurus ichikawai]
MSCGTRALKADTDMALMRGFLWNLEQEDEDRNTDGRMCQGERRGKTAGGERKGYLLQAGKATRLLA